MPPSNLGASLRTVHLSAGTCGGASAGVAPQKGGVSTQTRTFSKSKLFGKRSTYVGVAQKEENSTQTRTFSLFKVDVFQLTQHVHRGRTERTSVNTDMGFLVLVFQ